MNACEFRRSAAAGLILACCTGAGWGARRQDTAAVVDTGAVELREESLPGIKLKGDPVAAVVALANSSYQDSDIEMRVRRVHKERRSGRIHVRTSEYYKNVLVEGAGQIYHISPDSVLYRVDGSVRNRFSVDPEPSVRLADLSYEAMRDAANTRCMDEQCREVVELGQFPYHTNYDSLGMAEREVRITKSPRLVIYGDRLIYVLSVSERVLDFADWHYRFDAHTGEFLGKSNTMLYGAPSSSGYHTAVTGSKLTTEVNPATNEEDVIITGWRDTGSGTSDNYFLYFKGDGSVGGWGVYDSAAGGLDWAQQNTDDWGTTDRFAISLAKNLEIVQNWVTDTLEMHSLDDDGFFVKAYVRMSTDDNGVFMRNQEAFGFGASSGGSYTDQGHLNCVAHELGHGLTYFSSDMRGEACENVGLSEAYSDIVATAVEFSAQPDSTEEYPDIVHGTADWLYGEDGLTGDSVAIRDMRQPFRDDLDDLTSVPNKTYYDDSTYWVGYEDYRYRTGWPYVKGGCVRFAFHLLAEGSDTGGTNTGHPYPAFAGVGVAAAARIAMRANLFYLDDFSVFSDIRRTWRLSAQDLIDDNVVPSSALRAVDSAVFACGLSDLLRIRYAEATRLQIGPMGNVGLQGYGQENKSLAGFVIKHTGGEGACLHTTEDHFMASGTITDYDTTYLETPASIQGNLVFRDPNGDANMSIDEDGDVHIRVRDRFMAFVATNR